MAKKSSSGELSSVPPVLLEVPTGGEATVTDGAGEPNDCCFAALGAAFTGKGAGTTGAAFTAIVGGGTGGNTGARENCDASQALVRSDVGAPATRRPRIARFLGHRSSVRRCRVSRVLGVCAPSSAGACEAWRR